MKIDSSYPETLDVSPSKTVPIVDVIDCKSDD